MAMHYLVEVRWRVWCNAAVVKQVPKIREEYSAYCEFLAGVKTLALDTVALREGGRGGVRQGSVGVSWEGVSGAKRFQVEVSKDFRNGYKVKVFAEWFFPGPCFRFDSQGKAHCNPEDGRGLVARQVLTPHFHRFEQSGIEIAYKSAVLNDAAKAAAIVAQCGLGVAHFCHEGRLGCATRDYPEVVFDQADWDFAGQDPLAGVAFV